MINSNELYTTEKLHHEAHDNEYHQHVKGERGASNLPCCAYLTALKQLGIELPPLSDFQLKTDAAGLGTIIHEEIQGKLEHALQPPFLMGIEESRIYFKPEVYVWKQLFPNLKIISPLDLVYVEGKSNNPFGIRYYQFKNQKLGIPILKEGFKFAQIGDIKTAGSYKYYHKYAKGKLPWNNECQFLFYMFATGLKELEVFAINREDGNRCTFMYQWDAGKWAELVQHLKAELDLETALTPFIPNSNKWIDMSDMHFTEVKAKHLGCLDKHHENFDWYGCPLCEREEYTASDEDSLSPGKDKQRLTHLCPAAQRLLIELVGDRFIPQSDWTRTPEDNEAWKKKVEILSIDWDNMLIGSMAFYYSKYPQDFGRKRMLKSEYFWDTFEYAWINYKPLEEK